MIRIFFRSVRFGMRSHTRQAVSDKLPCYILLGYNHSPRGGTSVSPKGAPMIRLLAVIVPLALTGCGPSEYTLKIKERSRGDVEQVSFVNTVRRDMTAMADSGKVLKEQKTNYTETMVYTETILEKPDADKPATRRLREYETAQISEGEQRNLTLPYQGKTVLIEKKDGKWRYHVNNGPELTGEWAKYLENEF